jgi:hypothetical protein
MVLVDKLFISLDVLDDILSPSRLAREDHDFLLSVRPRLVQQPQDEGSVTLGELVPQSPIFQLAFVLLDAGR